MVNQFGFFDKMEVNVVKVIVVFCFLRWNFGLESYEKFRMVGFHGIHLGSHFTF